MFDTFGSLLRRLIAQIFILGVLVQLFVLLLFEAMALAQDVPPPDVPGAEAAPEAAAVAGLFGRVIHDPLLLSLVVSAVIGVVMAVRKILALILRAWGAAQEEAGNAEAALAAKTEDPKDDVPAALHQKQGQLKHKVADQIADVIDKPKS